MNRFSAVLLAIIMVLGLVVVSAPSAGAGGTFPRFQDGFHGDYIFCAPGATQGCVPPAWNRYHVSCIKNQDDLTQNVGIGFKVQGNPVGTFQGILLRKWTFCATDTGGKMQSIVVGPGYCLGWQRWTSTIYIYPPGVPGSGDITYFGVLLKYGNVYGNNLINYMFPINSANNVHYLISAYQC
jgi:hypothetical protein